MVKERIIETNEGIQNEVTIEVFDAFARGMRVLKPNGIFCVADLRRDVNGIVKWGTYLTAKPKEIKPGFLSSLTAAYTVPELEKLFEKSDFSTYSVTGAFFGIFAKAEKCN